MLFKALVRPEHMNQHGSLFGGYMLLWVDEYAYIAALEDYPLGRFVTRGMEAAEFSHPVKCGALLTFDVTRTRAGHSSVTYRVEVSARNMTESRETPVFSTSVTLCAVDELGRKTALPQGGFDGDFSQPPCVCK